MRDHTGLILSQSVSQFGQLVESVSQLLNKVILGTAMSNSLV